jgi:hypothetical protein
MSSDVSTQVDDFLAGYSPDVRGLALAARALVLSVLPGMIEQVDPPSGIIAYGYDRSYKGLVCAIAPHKSHVNLMFSRGTELPDPAGLLEGTGKRARHVKIRSLDDVRHPAVHALLEAAAASTR